MTADNSTIGPDRRNDRPLLDVLGRIRERGAIGESSLVDAVVHAERFVALVPERAASLADLGSGGGLPGLVIAWRRPHLEISFFERRGARADLLRRAVSGLGLSSVTVIEADVRMVAAERTSGGGVAYDVVTARSFGPLAITLRIARTLVDAGGVILVSEPPSGGEDRVGAVDLDALRVMNAGVKDGIRRFSPQ